MGKLLRIVPSREPGVGGFEPAPDGPLADDEDASQSVYALGLRSPFRGTRDSRGFYWIGDVGSDFFEEVNVVRAPLANFGWPDHEGPCSELRRDHVTRASRGRAAPSPDYIADDPEVETTVARVAWAGPEVAGATTPTATAAGSPAACCSATTAPASCARAAWTTTASPPSTLRSVT